MFELMIGLSVISFLIALFATPIVLFLLRLLEVVTRRIKLKDALIILLVPFSIGYFYLVPSHGVVKKIYHALSILFMVLTLLGAFFIFYMSK